MNRRTTRRTFMAWTAALASTAAACSRGPAQKGQSMTTPLTDLSASVAVAAMRRGELAAETYAAALLERCAAAASLNAFITLDPERVLEAARAADKALASGAEPGPLHGLPIPVKDSVNTSEYRTTGGTPALSEFHPAEDAEIVRRLREAGAIVMGKTNIHELSFGWTSNNQAFGAVRNPYDPTRIPGGSSGGTAAAIAARMAPLGIAEDTQGSIRVPAALCGIYGLRPTQDRYPNGGVIPITPRFDQVGPQARSVADLALFDHVVTGDKLVGSPASLDGLRLGVPKAYFYADLDNEVAAITATALAKLENAGVVLVEAEVPDLKHLIDLTTLPIQIYDAMPSLTRYLEEFDTGVSFANLVGKASNDIAATFAAFVVADAPQRPSEADFRAAVDTYLPALKKAMHDYFVANELDAMIFPATQLAATPIGQDIDVTLNGKVVPFEAVISRNISPGSTAGIPGLVVPAALTKQGLPVSLELDGPAGTDRRLLAIGHALENVLEPLPAPPV